LNILGRKGDRPFRDRETGRQGDEAIWEPGKSRREESRACTGSGMGTVRQSVDMRQHREDSEAECIHEAAQRGL
jgi:hypothetical protein